MARFEQAARLVVGGKSHALLVHSSIERSSAEETETQALAAHKTPADLDPINDEILDVLPEVKVFA